MRQIGEVIGTEDGRHVLVLCTDGGVLYFHCRPVECPVSGGDGSPSDVVVPFEGELLESASLLRDVDMDCAWALKSVGSSGEVVLLRAVSTYNPDAPSSTSIVIKPIAGTVPLTD